MLKSQKAKRDNGQGSWEEGFSCPEILISTTSGSYEIQGKGKFWPKKLINPVSEIEKIGWVFEMTTPPGETLKKVFIRDGTSNNYFIPFRYISENFGYTNPYYGFKYLEAKLTNDAKETYKFKVHLPWKSLTDWYIDDKEANTISSKLNTCRFEEQEKIKIIKKNATDAASKYITNEPFYQASKTSANSLKIETDKAVATSADLAVQIKTTQGQIATTQAEITELENKLTAARNDYAELNSKLNSLTSQKNSYDITIKQLQTNIQSKTTQKTTFETATADAMKLLIEKLNLLKSLTTKTNECDLALEEVKKTKPQLQLFTNYLNLIYPVYLDS